jgi:hypothetical protein
MSPKSNSKSLPKSYNKSEERRIRRKIDQYGTRQHTERASKLFGLRL